MAAAMELKDGSRWVDWSEWLASHSALRVAAPAIGATEKGNPPANDAPSTYVLQR